MVTLADGGLRLHMGAVDYVILGLPTVARSVSVSMRW
jgi:hypothetical protein